MEMIFCPNCNKLTGYKRAIGFGTFFAVVLTAGLWLLAIPFYPKRCITCGLTKSASVPWYQTWRVFVFPLVAIVLIALFVGIASKENGQHVGMVPIVKGPNYNEVPRQTDMKVKTSNTNTQTSASLEAPKSVDSELSPATLHDIKVYEPNRVIPESAENICGFDFRNSRMFAREYSVVLKNGRYAKQGNMGSETVDLKNMYCLHGYADRALVVTEWTDCGATCGTMSGVAQVFELRNNHPVITQEIVFDSKMQGAGATFDENTLKLTIVGRYYDPEDAECCPKNFEVVTYGWQGHKFVQSSYERKPVSSIAPWSTQPYDGESSAPEQYKLSFDNAKSECLSLVSLHFPKLEFWPDPAWEENSRSQYRQNDQRLVLVLGFDAGMPENGSGDAVCEIQGSGITLKHVQLGILSYNFDSNGNLTR